MTTRDPPPPDDSMAMSVPVPQGENHGLCMPSMETPWLLVQNTGASLPGVAPQRGQGRGGGAGRRLQLGGRQWDGCVLGGGWVDNVLNRFADMNR